jgi:5-methylcytosine-specific restriction enzyme A
MADLSGPGLSSLKPTRDRKIMDLVAEAGVDVTPWAKKQDGTAVKTPSANPSYCYEWAFGGSGEPSVVCVWHTSLSERGDVVLYEDNLRQHALLLDRIAIDRQNPSHVKSRARDQAARARRFDGLLQRALRTQQPVRVVLLDGAARAKEELGWERSEVKFRALDSEPWHMQSYEDDTGTFTLVRGAPAALPGPEVAAESRKDIEPAAATPAPAALPKYVDQFSVPTPPERRDTSGSAFVRSAAIRDAVLRRAKGSCEHCGKPGFMTASGSIYLETHHVIALSEDGPDAEWNVVGICATDHRRAHFGVECDGIRSTLLARLALVYPAEVLALRAIINVETNAPKL